MHACWSIAMYTDTHPTNIRELYTHLIENILAGVSPAVLSDQERDGGRVSTIGLEVVQALCKPVCVQVAVVTVFLCEREAAHHHTRPVLGGL